MQIEASRFVDTLPVHSGFKRAIEQALQGYLQSRWARLPLLCCEATGGSPFQSQILQEVVSIAATSATILDDIQDADTDDALWRKIGVPQALNLGVSLIFAGQIALEQLSLCGVSDLTLSTIQKSYVRLGLTMCEGQHHDLVNENLTFEDYQRMVEGKTASFSAWCCEIGAITGNPDVDAAPYATFGHHLGSLHQIVNDLGGLYGLGGKADVASGKKTTLPITLGRSLAPPHLRKELDGLSEAGMQREIQLILLHDLGLAEFVRTVTEYHYTTSLSALRSAKAVPHAEAGLKGILDSCVAMLQPNVGS